MAWAYEKGLKRYRNKENGQFLSNAKMLDLRDKFVSSQKEKARALVDDLAEKRITIQSFERKFRDVVKESFTDSYALGIGGRNNMTSDDFTRLGELIKVQFNYAHELAGQVVDGDLSESMMRFRAGNFIESASYAFQVGRGKKLGIDLPTYPRDGSQDCYFNCGCEWRITEKDETVEAVWVRHKEDSCDTCLSNEGKYNPLVLEKVAA